MSEATISEKCGGTHYSGREGIWNSSEMGKYRLASE